MLDLAVPPTLLVATTLGSCSSGRQGLDCSRFPALVDSPMLSGAIEALGLSPTELAQRGYPLDSEVTSPAIVPEDGP